MAVYGYTFITEVENFDLAEYIPYEGWISSFPMLLRFYSKEASENYFLHDPTINRLFEFKYGPDAESNESYKFQNAGSAYELRYPRNFDR